MRLVAARQLVTSLWVGSLWVIGYLAAPTLFAHADSALAGQMVGHLLASVAWLSMVCALLMWFLIRFAPDLDDARRRQLKLIVYGMLGCTLIVYVGLQPEMARLREAAGPGGVRNSPQWTEFAILHGIAQLIYVVESVLGGALVIKSR
jgi:hypothetical protein